MLSFEQGVTFSLRIDMQSDTAAALAIRGMTREGMFTYSATTGSNSLITQATFALPDIPIYITVEDAGRVLAQGSAFVSVSLLANGNVIQQLVSGYIYGQKALSWPNTQQVDLRTGGGKLSTITVANPAAGSDWTKTVPAGEIWLVHSVRFTLLTSAAVQDRLVMLSITQAGVETLRVFSPAFETAGNAERDYSIAEFGYSPVFNFDIFRMLPMPSNTIVAPGGIIASATDTIAGGDTYSEIQISIEKYFTTP